MMKTLVQLLCIAVVFMLTAPALAIKPGEAAFDAIKAEPFRQKNEKFKTVEKEGKAPGPWQFSAFADGAIAEISLLPDAGDGKAAFRIVNLAGQASAMLKPWRDVVLDRGMWEARIEYRKNGSSRGRFVVDAPNKQVHRLDLPPTDGGFKSLSLPFEISGNSANLKLTFQLYAGTGENEALLLRSFRLEKVGDVSQETKAAEQQAKASAQTEAEQVAAREAARRIEERKPINGWVRPDAKPVKMTKPLAPPPVTGKTYFVATTGSNDSGDGSEAKPWKTIQHGMNQLHPGDCLYIRGGEYRESMLTFARSGRADAYITVAGYPGEIARVINPGGITVFNLDAGSRWSPTNLDERAYLVIRDLHIDAVKGNQAVRINGPMQLDGYRGNLPKSRGIRHNIWVTGCDITGGNGNESVMGAAYGAHDIVISNNRIHNCLGGMNSYLFSDGTIIEFNQIFNTSSEQDDAGAIKSMAPNVIIRYNTVHNNNRSETAIKPGWAPASEGGKQWRFLQGISGIYIDYAMVDDKNNTYPKPLIPQDPANYVYGNTVYRNNAGIFAFRSDHAHIFDNVAYENGRDNTGGWVEGKKGGKWLEFTGPAGHGIRVAATNDIKVYNNISYGNQKSGLALAAANTQAWGNVVFGNDAAQIHIQRADRVFTGFNTILATGKQGPPMRRLDKDFSDPAALRKAHPYYDEGTQIIAVPGGTDALVFAKQHLATQKIDLDTWQQAQERLAAAARAAGVGQKPQVVAQAPFDPSGGLQQPLPWRIPGVIEFENYDVGGQGVSFHDNDEENQGGHYRKDAVDIKANPKAGNGAVVGFTQTGEWLEYTIAIAQAGTYAISITYATPEPNRSVKLELDGKPLGLPIQFTPTANWDELNTSASVNLDLPAGDHVLRVTIESGPVDLDCIRVEQAK